MIDKLDMIGATFLCLLVIIFCVCASVVFIFSTFRWLKSNKKPPCQHDLMVCDYRRTYDDSYNVNEQYLAACKKCGITNWVEPSYLNEMTDLGLYKKEGNHND